MRHNPLFAKNDKSIEVTATDAKISPFSGKPMVKVLCRDIPAWCDLQNRIVLPLTDV